MTKDELIAEHDGRGWHSVEVADDGAVGRPGHQVWYGPVLIVDGLPSRELARQIMLRRAVEQETCAEDAWLEADARRNFCRSEVARLRAEKGS